jgi:hypothetical protein
MFRVSNIERSFRCTRYDTITIERCQQLNNGFTQTIIQRSTDLKI